MKQLTVRGVPPDLASALEEERRKTGLSLNQTVLNVLRRALGRPAGARYDNGLRALAGTWSDAELTAFEAHTAGFEEVDEDLWR